MNNHSQNAQHETMPPQIENAIQSILDQPIDEFAIGRVKIKAKSIATSPAKSPRNQRRLMATLSVAAVLGLAVIVIYAIVQSPSKSYAQAVENVKAAKTMRFNYQSRFILEDVGVILGKQLEMKNSGRIQISGNKMRNETESFTTIFNGESKSGILLMNDRQVAFMVSAPIDIPDLSQWIQSSTSRDAVLIGEEVLENKKTRHFRIKNAEIMDKNIMRYLGNSRQMDVWVDIESQLPWKVEVISSGDKPGNYFVFDQIEFDTPMDDKLFTTDLPGGFKLIQQSPSSQPSKAEAATTSPGVDIVR